MAYVKLVGTANRHTDWTTEIVLEKDDEGNPTKVVRAGEPVDLSKADQEKIEDLGYSFESSSKSEAEEVRESAVGPVGTDSSRFGPLLGDSEKPNQSADDADYNDD